jgi:hypothetical protein
VWWTVGIEGRTGGAGNLWAKSLHVLAQFFIFAPRSNYKMIAMKSKSIAMTLQIDCNGFPN